MVMFGLLVGFLVMGGFYFWACPPVALLLGGYHLVCWCGAVWEGRKYEEHKGLAALLKARANVQRVHTANLEAQQLDKVDKAWSENSKRDSKEIFLFWGCVAVIGLIYWVY